MELRKKVLESIAENYHNNDTIEDIHIENLCQDYFITWLREQVNADDSVLELGYGDGIVSAVLAETVSDLTILEGASSLVEIAKGKLPQVNCVDTLFEDFKPTKKYDVILASHVLEHVDDPVSILKQMTSWLSDNGKMIIVVPNKNSIHRQLSVIMGLQPELDTLSKRDHLVGHQRVYSLETLASDIQAAGLMPIEEVGFFLKVLPNSMMLDYSNELLMALNKVSKEIPANLLANIGMVVKKANV